MNRPIRIAFVLAAAAVVLLPAAPGFAKKAGEMPADHPLLKRIASMSVERGREHRVLAVLAEA